MILHLQLTTEPLGCTVESPAPGCSESPFIPVLELTAGKTDTEYIIKVGQVEDTMKTCDGLKIDSSSPKG